MNLPEEKNNQYQEGPSELDDMLDVGEEITVEEMPDEHEQGIVQEHILQQDVYGEDDIVEYIDDSVAAEEIVLDEDGMLMEEDDIATQSLVALSRGPRHKNKSVREFIRQAVPMTSKEYQQHQARNGPRILRRPMTSGVRTTMYDINTRAAQLPRPNYPIPMQTKRLLPVATVPIGGSSKHMSHGDRQKDWREEQRRMLEVYEIYDCLPEHMKEPFKRVLEMRGEPMKLSPPKRNQGQMRMMSQREQYSEEHQMDNDGSERHPQYKESRDHDNDMMMQEDQHHMQKNDVDMEELADMPQLEQAPQDESRSHQNNADQIDVEGYDSGEEHDIRGGVEYILDPEDVEIYERQNGSYKNSFMRQVRPVGQVIVPSMREEYYGTMDVNQFSANQIMIGNQIQESRYCPGCKMTLKRSVFYHHSRMIKKYGVCNMFTPKRFPCGISGCEERLGTVEKLCEHMWQIHGAPTEIKTEVFNSEPDFEVFLRELEGKGGNFRMSRGNKLIKAGVVQYFRCNRMQSLAKDRTVRACDELSIYGSPLDQRPEEDPFAAAGGKPCLRTEEACTAFFRKAYLQNGSIEVRYCDHHLHEDERVRLPAVLKDRIFEMSRKNLPAAVIMMVLQNEREKFCQPGSAIERRIMALTPRDVTNTLVAKNSVRRKKKSAPYQVDESLTNANRMTVVQIETLDHNGDPIASVSNKDVHQEELIEEQEGAYHHPPSRPHVQVTSVSPNVPEEVENVNRSELSELEQKMLDTYEANHEVILTDIQKLKRTENKKRHQRETIRGRIYALGRFIKTMNFSDMPSDRLEEMANGLKEVIECTRGKQEREVFCLSIPQEVKKSSIKMESLEDEHIDVVSNDSRKGKKRKLKEGELEEDADTTIDSAGSVIHEQTREYGEDMEQIIIEADSPISRKKQKKAKEARKEEQQFEESTETSSEKGSNLPSITRTGRVVRPRNILDV